MTKLFSDEDDFQGAREEKMDERQWWFGGTQKPIATAAPTTMRPMTTGRPAIATTRRPAIATTRRPAIATTRRPVPLTLNQQWDKLNPISWTSTGVIIPPRG